MEIDGRAGNGRYMTCCGASRVRTSSAPCRAALSQIVLDRLLLQTIECLVSPGREKQKRMCSCNIDNSGYSRVHTDPC